MKTSSKAIRLSFILVLLLLLHSCINDEQELKVTTLPVTNITYQSGTIGMSFSGGSDWPGTKWGICVDTIQNPTYEHKVIDSNNSNFIYTKYWSLEGLIPSTIYHVRAFVQKAEIVYGSDVEFKTQSFDKSIDFNPNSTYGSISDIDDNTYKTIKIGTQVWMAENLKVTKYRNGSNISDVNNKVVNSNDTVGAFCYYNNGNIYDKLFGCLYNYYAVADKRGLCPIDWHVPTNDEWKILVEYLGGEDIAGAKLKESGTMHWNRPNDEATNETGFTALPGGYRGAYTTFNLVSFEVGTYGIWWSTTEYMSNPPSSLITDINIYSPGRCFVGRETGYHANLYSVRCLKN